jgi:5,10-methylenetetrahydromethanopterin reductase
MRFGFAQVPRENVANHVALMKAAEDLGFDCAWLTDQTFFRDPYVLLSVALESTSRIGIGIGVTNAYTRHPVMTARAVGTMNELGPGRVRLGIGAGNRQELLEPLGFRSDHQAPRIREAVAIWRRLLKGERLSFRGKHFEVQGVRLLTPPAPDVPIYIGGRGPRILEAAGEIADGVIIGGLCTARGMSYAIEHIRKGTERSGREIANLDVVCWATCFVTGDLHMQRESIKPWIAHFIAEAPPEVVVAVGLDSATVTAIRSAYEDGGSEGAARYVTDECIDGFSLIGEPAEITDRIEALAEAGVTHFCMLLPTGNVADHEIQVERFAQAVFPRFG